MPRFFAPYRTLILLVSLAAMIMTCEKDDPGGDDETIIGEFNNFTQSYGWKCTSGNNCQDIFDLEFAKGTQVTFKISPVSAGSTAQIALYDKDTPLGGINQFTQTTNELRCNTERDCNKNTAGQTVNNFIAPNAGTYRLAVSRNWSLSCGAEGTYTLTITADRNFKVVKQSGNDLQAKVSSAECK